MQLGLRGCCTGVGGGSPELGPGPGWAPPPHPGGQVRAAALRPVWGGCPGREDALHHSRGAGDGRPGRAGRQGPRPGTVGNTAPGSGANRRPRPFRPHGGRTREALPPGERGDPGSGRSVRPPSVTTPEPNTTLELEGGGGRASQVTPLVGRGGVRMGCCFPGCCPRIRPIGRSAQGARVPPLDFPGVRLVAVWRSRHREGCQRPLGKAVFCGKVVRTESKPWAAITHSFILNEYSHTHFSNVSHLEQFGSQPSCHRKKSRLSTKNFSFGPDNPFIRIPLPDKKHLSGSKGKNAFVISTFLKQKVLIK